VFGKISASSQSSEIDDALHARLPCGRGEAPGGVAVALGEVSRSGHRMDEVVGRADAGHGAPERCLVEDVAGHPFGRRCRRDRGAPDEGAHRDASTLERLQEPAADVAGGAGQQDHA
jgi:hypothetical protein